jgi:GTPase
MIPRTPEPERGFVLAVLAQGTDPDEELAEIKELARTAGVEPVGFVVQHRARPAQRTYVGKGKIEELKERFKESDAESVIVDGELDPSQQRYLENALNTRVVDRTQLILDIFAQHATSAEGKLQVELAQLDYNLPRMRGMWQHLDRLGGGVGTRGPGESQLESDRRMARQRINQLRRRLKDLGKQRETRRKERTRSETPAVALAGYTNVGKSTLLNALTGSDVSRRLVASSTTGAAISSPTRSVSSVACRPSSSRASRPRSRRRSAPTSSCTSSTPPQRRTNRTASARPSTTSCTRSVRPTFRSRSC